jgi:transposase
MDAAAATPIHFVGIDVSLDRCAVRGDLSGAVVREANLACDPETLIAFLHGLSLDIACVGLEARPLSQWLHRHLREAGQRAVLMETRQSERRAPGHADQDRSIGATPLESRS